LANLSVGAAGLGYAVLVPAVVLRRFGTGVYGTWYLAFQVAAYILLLDLGTQYLVTREASGSAPGLRPARIATAAMVIQLVLAVVVVIVATAWAGITGQRTLAQVIPILGVAAIASLLASTVRAWFGGLQRAHVPAVWLVGARLLAVAGLLGAFAARSGLVTLTLAVALPQLVVHAGLLVWVRRPPSPWARPERAVFVQLLRSGLPLAIWTVCGFLITGIDVFVVHALAPSEVGQYAIALPLLAIPTGVVTAATTAWLPRAARVEATSLEGGRDVTLAATTVMTAVLAFGAIPFIGYAGEVVRLWAGADRGGPAAVYLQLLYLAFCLRFAFLPWSMLVVVRGDQGRLILAPLAEAAANVGTSVLLGLWLGALGVALGTLAGAVVAALLSLGWSVPRTQASGIRPIPLVRAAAAAWLPITAASAVALLAVVGAPAIWRGLAAAVALGLIARWLSERAGMVKLGMPVTRLEPAVDS